MGRNKEFCSGHVVFEVSVKYLNGEIKKAAGKLG